MSSLIKVKKMNETRFIIPRRTASRSLFFEALEDRYLLSISPSAIYSDANDNYVVTPVPSNDIIDVSAAVEDETLESEVLNSDGDEMTDERAKTLKILFIGNSLSEDARTFIANAAAQYPWIDPDNIKIGSLYQGGRSVGYFANCARVERGEDASAYDYDFYTYTNNSAKTQIDAENNGYLDATKNFCEYYEWTGVNWKQLKNEDNLGEKTIAFAMEREDWDVVLVEGFYCDYMDGTEENGFDGTMTSFDPAKEKGSVYNLRESFTSNLEYLCDYLRELDQKNNPEHNADIGLFLPTIHHETQPNWLNGDVYASMIRTAEYVQENVDCIDFIVPACTAVENAKTTYLTFLTNGDSKDTVLEGLRRDSIHSSYYLARELVAMGIVDSVLEHLYGSDDFDVRADYAANLKVESPIFGSLPIEYMDILQEAVSAARDNPFAITPLSMFPTEDPTVTAYDAAVTCDGDVKERVKAAQKALTDRQWADVVVNYEESGGIGALSFSYGYTTSDTIKIVLDEVDDSSENNDDSPNNSDSWETPTTTVNSLFDVVNATDGLITLREAIMVYANDGDTITFDETLGGGTIVLGGSEITTSKSLTIDASALYNAGVPGITIDANDVSRVFNIESGATTLKALTIAHGRSESFGGAIYLDSFAELTVEDSVFLNNTSLGGGAIYAVFSGTLTISNTSLYGNVATFYGGAVYACSGSTLTLDGTSLHDNEACYSGGAIRVAASSLTIQDSIFYRNAAEYGGAIDSASSSTLVIERSELNGNKAVKYGGAVYASGKSTTHTIVSSRIYENVANNGGGLYVSGYDTTFTINNSVLYGNTTRREGSAVEVLYADFNLYCSTIAANTSVVEQGAVYAAYSSIGFYNSIVAQNKGDDVVRKGGKSRAYNVLTNMRTWGNYDAIFSVYDKTQPLFTDPENYNFTLAEGSQAINKGDDVFVGVWTDVSGNWRVMGSNVDLGAYEYLIEETASTIVDSLADTVDPYDGVVTLREAITIYSNDGDMITFDPFLAGGTILLGGTELSIAKSLTVDASMLQLANEPGVTIDANSLSRVFNVDPNVSFSVSGVKLTGGYADEGGAIYASENSTLTIENSIIFENEALVGGGVSAYTTITIENSRIDDNYAEFGGAVYVMGNADSFLTIKNSTLCGNKAGFYGGAVYAEGANVTAYSATISMNASTGSGAIHVFSDEEGVSLNLYNSIVAENDGDDVLLEDCPQAYAYRVLSSFDGWSNEDGAYLYTPDLPLFTDPENGDFTLAENSQALDLGDVVNVISDFDVAGSVRVANGAADLGAYETSTIVVEYDATAGQTSLSWRALSGASSYLVEISSDGGFSWNSLALEQNVLSTIVEGLVEGTQYEFRVTGLDEFGEALDTIQSVSFSPKSLANLDVTFHYDDNNQQATLTWEALEGAESYLVKISKTNGVRWTVAVKNLDETSTTINDVKVGSSYMFRVYGVDSNGALLSTVEETTLAPIHVDGSVNPFVTVTPGPVGSQVVVSLSGAANSSANVKWYYITEDGDVEIEEAAGLLEYTFMDTDYEVKIVATGVGDSEGSNAELTVVDTIEFDYNALSRQAIMSWRPIDGAKSYTVEISKNGGETWSTLAKTPEPFTTVNGLYASKSYSFRVRGIAKNNTPLSTIQGATFAPITITASVSPCNRGRTIEVDVTGADDATVVLNWYYITEDGDVEIEEAAGLSRYTTTNTLYNVKVVATGTGDSAGSNAEVVIVETLEFDYRLATRQAEITWDEVEGANSYTVKITKDDGATWQTIGRGLTNRSIVANGLYASKNYSFQIYGVAKSGAFLSTVQTGTFAPISLSANVRATATSRTITAAITGAENASASLKWYYVTDDGDVEIEEAAGLNEYTTENLENDVRVVATGSGVSRGSVAEMLVVDTLAVDFNPATHEATLTWDEVEGATSYTVKISKDDGETWATYLTDLEEATTVVRSVYAGNSYSFQVKANGTEVAVVQCITFAPVSINVNMSPDAAGQTVMVELMGSDNASADIRWYYLSDNGDVEIEEAAGLNEYTVPEIGYDVKIVAMGTGNSKSSIAIAFIASGLNVSYDQVTRQASLSWNPVADATSYTIKTKKSSESSWSTAKKVEAEEFATAIEEGRAPAVLNGFYTGESYDLIVVANGASVSSIQRKTIAPVSIVPSIYATNGKRAISIEFSGANNSAADVRWYYVTDDGNIEIKDAAGLLEYIPEDSNSNVRIVATGTGASEGSSSEVLVVDTIGVEYDAANRVATLTWDNVEDATGYTVKVSKNSGRTWSTYAKVTTNSVEVSEIYLNQSYSFQVVSTGSRVAVAQGATFAPIASSTIIKADASGRTVNVVVSGAANSSADVTWYYVTDEGEIEIENAAGRFEYTLTDTTCDARVVVTGTGDSEGMAFETIILDTISIVHNATSGQTTLTWAPVANAESYTVALSEDNGQSWLVYASGLMETTTVVEGPSVGDSYMFMISTAGVSTVQGATFAPFQASVNVVAGTTDRTVYVNIAGAENATAYVRWYYITNEGDVEIEDAAGFFEYTLTDMNCDVRVVVTGTGDSEGFHVEKIVDNTGDDGSYALLAEAFANLVDDDLFNEF